MKKVNKEFGELNITNLREKMNEAEILQYYVFTESKTYVGLYCLNEIYFAVALTPGRNPLMDFADSKHDGIESFAYIIYEIRSDNKVNC